MISLRTSRDLREARHSVPRRWPIGRVGWQKSNGYFRFLYPRCSEMRATVNPRNNLAHCFSCQKNLNNIDLLITQGYAFLAAVEVLEGWLEQYQAHQGKKNPAPRK